MKCSSTFPAFSLLPKAGLSPHGRRRGLWRRPLRLPSTTARTNKSGGNYQIKCPFWYTYRYTQEATLSGLVHPVHPFNLAMNGAPGRIRTYARDQDEELAFQVWFDSLYFSQELESPSTRAMVSHLLHPT